MKILIAGFQHETNTFAPTKARGMYRLLEDLEERPVVSVSFARAFPPPIFRNVDRRSGLMRSTRPPRNTRRTHCSRR